MSIFSDFVVAICNRGADPEQEQPERTEPTIAALPAPQAVSEPQFIEAVQVAQPAITQIQTQPSQVTNMKKVFIAVPVNNKTPQEIQTAKSMAESFCRAIWASQGETIEVLHYSDMMAASVDCRYIAIGRHQRVFTLAMQCDAAFFSAGCEQDPFLEIIRADMDASGMAYHHFCFKGATVA